MFRALLDTLELMLEFLKRHRDLAWRSGSLSCKNKTPPLKIGIIRSSRFSQETLRSPLRYALDFHSLAPARGFLLGGGNVSQSRQPELTREGWYWAAFREHRHWRVDKQQLMRNKTCDHPGHGLQLVNEPFKVFELDSICLANDLRF